MERVRQREDHVDVWKVEQLTLTRDEPALACLRLTLRAVSVATRVVRDRPMSAGATPIDMAAERGGPTPPECAQDGAFAARSATGAARGSDRPARVEDIGHLHGGPAHDWGGFRMRRDRGIVGGGVRCSCSSGLGAAWR
jgi:hypothetical protein